MNVQVKNLLIILFMISLIGCSTSANLNQSFKRGDESPFIHTGSIPEKSTIVAIAETHFSDPLKNEYRIPQRGANYRSYQTRNSLTLGYISPVKNIGYHSIWVNTSFGTAELDDITHPDFADKNPIAFGYSQYRKFKDLPNSMELGIAYNGTVLVQHYYARNNARETGLDRYVGGSLSVQPIFRKIFDSSLSVFINPLVGVQVAPYKAINTGWNLGVEIPMIGRRLSIGAGQHFSLQLGESEMQESLRNLTVPLNVFVSLR